MQPAPGLDKPQPQLAVKASGHQPFRPDVLILASTWARQTTTVLLYYFFSSP